LNSFLNKKITVSRSLLIKHVDLRSNFYEEQKMMFEWGWHILPLAVSIIVFGIAIIVNVFIFAIGQGVSGPSRDVTSFFSADALFFFLLYLFAALISAIAWGIYFLVV
jgi:hypothetical protein